MYVQYFFGLNYSDFRKAYCYAEKDNTRANRLCNSLGTKGSLSNIWTPSGIVSNYYMYRIKS